MLRTCSHWENRYINRKSNTSALFLHLGFYNDDFGWMGSGQKERKQTVLIITCYEISRGTRGRPKSLACFPISIFPTKLTYNLGPDKILELFTVDITALISGIEFVFRGQSFLVIGILWMILGDVPARKEIVGMSKSSINSRCCHVCEVELDQFVHVTSANEVPTEKLRCPSFFAGLLQQNSGIVGKIIGNDAIAMLNGIDRVSEMLKWPGCNIPQNITIDIMHMLYLGEVGHIWHRISVILSRGNRNFWEKIASEYKQYCSQNHIDSFYNFKNIKEWKGLRGSGIKHFTEVIVYILYKLNYAPERNDPIYKDFQYFCFYIFICQKLSAHKITAQCFDKLEFYIKKLLIYMGSQEQNGKIKLNAHFLVHCIPHIKAFGNLRDHWSFVFEFQNGIFKKLFRTSNNVQVSYSVYDRFLSLSLLELVNQNAGLSKNIASSEQFQTSFMSFIVPHNVEIVCHPLLEDSSAQPT